MDSIPPSATNAAGGTRVIGVGCRYYTTLRRGVFIAETKLRQLESVGRTNLVFREAECLNAECKARSNPLAAQH